MQNIYSPVYQNAPEAGQLNSREEIPGCPTGPQRVGVRRVMDSSCVLPIISNFHTIIP